MATAAPILCMSAQTAEPVPLIAGDGNRRWQKDILIPEKLMSRAQGWTLDLDTAKLQQYADTFRKMQANGVRVPVTLDHSPSATAVLGYVEDMFVVNERLYAQLTTTGPHADLPAVVKTVSVEIEPDYADGKGNAYGEAITAVSIVQQPVVPGQTDFIPLGLDPARVLYLSLDAANGGRKVAAMPNDYEDDKKKAAMPTEDEQKNAAQGPDDSAPVQASDEAMAPVGVIAQALGLEIAPGTSLDEALSAVISTIQAMKQAAKPAEASPEVMALSLDAVTARVSQLVGRELVFDDAGVRKITEALAGTEAKPNAKMLAINAGGKSAARAVAEVLLSLAKPVQAVATPASKMNFANTPAPNANPGGDASPRPGSPESLRLTAKAKGMTDDQIKRLGLN